MKCDELHIVLGEYKGMHLTPIEIMSDEGLVEKRLEELVDAVSSPVSTDSAIHRGDHVSIAYKVLVGNRGFNGSFGKMEDLEIGSHRFISGFEEHLLGHKKGEKVCFSINFPTSHIREELQGRIGSFEVSILDVLRKPEYEITDDYIAQVSEFGSVEELRLAIAAQLEAENSDETIRYIRKCISDGIAEITQVEDDPQVLQELVDVSLHEYEDQVVQQGTTLEAEAAKYGATKEEYISILREQVQRGLVVNTALREIAQAEGLVVEETDIEAEVKRLAALSEQPINDVLEMIKAVPGFENDIKDDLLRQKAMDFIFEHAVIVNGAS